VGRLESVTAAVSPSSITSLGLRAKDTSPTGSVDKVVHTSVITQRSAATAEVISTKMSKESRIPSPRASAIEHTVAKIPSSRVEEPIKAQIATVRTIEKEKGNIKSSARVKSVVLERETKPAPSVITRGAVRESGLGAEPSAASLQIIKKVSSTANTKVMSGKVVKEDLSDFIAFLMATLRKTKIYKYIEGMFWVRAVEGAQDINEEEIEEDAENLGTDEGTEVTHQGLRPDPHSVVDTLQRKDRRTEITFEDAV
jgi:hypothetical protein